MSSSNLQKVFTNIKFILPYDYFYTENDPYKFIWQFIKGIYNYKVHFGS